MCLLIQGLVSVYLINAAEMYYLLFIVFQGYEPYEPGYEFEAAYPEPGWVI